MSIKEETVKDEKSETVFVKCGSCGEPRMKDSVHLCVPQFVRFPKSNPFVAHPTETQPISKEEVSKLKRHINSIIYTASALVTLQLLEEQGIEMDNVPCGPQHRMALVESIEDIGEAASVLIDKMEDRL